MSGAPEPFDVVDVIRAKRDGRRLTDAEIDWVLGAYTRDRVAEEQMAALAMAVCIRGLDSAELARWTAAMAAGGDRLDFSALGRPTVDKHSTGGVGDKITLPLVPIVAACGVAVPQLSGRGLGYTGGTLDKMESIPGWRADLPAGRLLDVLRDVGGVIAAPSERLAPADRKLYALRDVTGTVESIPLIASSIMSKKIAEGAAALVLDVKVGSGAFMTDLAAARGLATAMVALGEGAGVRTRALITGMDTPLGRTAGNALEVAEALEVLAGGGPDDVVELTLTLAREMLELAGATGADPAAALAGGRAMDVWRAMVRAQGGDPDAPLPRARHTQQVSSPADGVLTRLDARGVGVAAWRLGAGRTRRGEPVQAAAGVEIHVREGELVRAGQPVLTLHTDDPGLLARAREAAQEAIVVGEHPRTGAQPLVLERVG